MIRLKNILLEYEDSHETQLNVLFIVDDDSLKRSGFVRHIISQRVVVGEIESADEQSSESLKDIVLTQANPEIDLIVIISRGVYDNEPMQVLRNFEIIEQYANTINVPVVFFTIPTIRFIVDKKDISSNWTEIERIKINNILEKRFDNVIKLSNLDQDEYFRKDGKTYNLNAHLTLYKLLFNTILKFDSNAEIKNDIATLNIDISKVQDKLEQLGYNIDREEINLGIAGATTVAAIQLFQKEKGYPPSADINKSTSKAILQEPIDDDLFVNTKCTNPKYPNSRIKHLPSKYKGINGIKSKLSLQTVYGVTLDLYAAQQYKLMIDAMALENIAPIGTPDGFRSYQRQYDMFDWDLYECTGLKRTKKEGNVQAFPGKSNHGMGLAIDVSGVKAQQWITNNGNAYGWYWGEAKSEKWHFTFDPKTYPPTITNAQDYQDQDTDSKDQEKGLVDKAKDIVTDKIPALKNILNNL